ncbi:MAG: hypothetical protein AB7O86_04130 [Porticoccaceae bacterium]
MLPDYGEGSDRDPAGYGFAQPALCELAARGYKTLGADEPTQARHGTKSHDEKPDDTVGNALRGFAASHGTLLCI